MQDFYGREHIPTGSGEMMRYFYLREINPSGIPGGSFVQLTGFDVDDVWGIVQTYDQQTPMGITVDRLTARLEPITKEMFLFVFLNSPLSTCIEHTHYQ